MPGPKKQYPERLYVRIDKATLATLDKLRGTMSRSEAIRALIIGCSHGIKPTSGSVDKGYGKTWTA